MNPDLLSRLKNVTNLPTPPAVAAHVISLAQLPEVALSDLAEAITCDASLTTKVLRVANSPMYAQRRKSTNLHQALIVMGINGAVTLTLGFSLLPMLRRSPDQNKHLAFTWKRSVLSAVSARVMAKRLKMRNSEEAFLAALLQDIGIMAIDRIDPEFYSDHEDLFDDHQKLSAHEAEQLGDDHAAIGAWLLNNWGLPDYLRDTIAVSHNLDSSDPDPQRQVYSRCVALSGYVADLWLQEGDEEAGFSEVADIAERTLGIDRETFAMIMGEIGTNIPDMAATFQTELLTEQDAQLIVERAQEALTLRNLVSIQEVAELGKKTRQLKSLAHDLEKETQQDALTKVANRGHLDEVLDKGFAHAKRFGWTLSIAFVDLDFFKKVNDDYGHQAGDEVLRNIANELAELVRATDTVGRYGGEEFVLILPGADENGAVVVGERVLSHLRKLTHKVGSGDADSIVVTASIGCATLSEGNSFSTVAEFLAAADKALYSAKKHGRNRVVTYQDDSAKEVAQHA